MLNQQRNDTLTLVKENGCRELQSIADWERGWAALVTLRPKLSLEDFVARKPQLERDGYHLVGLFRGGECVCVASYTLSPHPVFGREMIIHDMSTLNGHQSTGCGSELLQYLDQLAVSLGCGRTFVATAKAAKFYEKNGYTAHATALKKIHGAE
jgi:GNAT superfamily N-acetyltransferase